LQGSITPNSLHFERHHAGIPDIDPAQHKLVIHGLVRQPLVFSYEDLLRYPMVSKIYFLECSGNSGSLFGPNPADGSAQSLHGLVSGAEWTGIPLSTLLDEAGVDPDAQWINAVGADAASMGRSIPLNRAMDDVMLALFQNGEPVRPGQGYPMRLFVPGCEGNISVKWLTQIKLTREPTHFRDETSKYTDTRLDRKSQQFTFPMGTKSVITAPSGQMKLERQGIYQVTGIAWSGRGSVRRVEVSADGGRTWADAMIDSHQSEKALARFRIPWQWSGGDAVLQSRATDSQGNVQPTRTSLVTEKGNISTYHFHGIQSWAVNTSGDVANVYA
jgi:sulfane dehydrogenase subunit SoxC